MTASHNPLDLSGKVVLVTGASSGIGRASAVLLARLGARVVLSGRRADALEETRQAMPDAPAHPIEPFDLSELDGISGWLHGVRQRAGAPLDGLLHSAGVATLAPLRTASRKSVDAMMLPNVYAALMLLKGMSAKGVASAPASVVLLSSVASVFGSPGLVAYAASKGALNSLVRSAAKELAPKGIRVNAIAPGYVRTPMYDQAKAGNPGNFEQLEAQHLLGLPSPDDVGTMAAYLMCDASRVVTGTTLVIDGGYSA